MAFTKYTKDTTIIGALGTNPAERGLTTQEFKDKFDQFATEFVEWFNETHLPEVAEKAVVDEHKAETVQQEGGLHGIEIETGVFTPYIKGDATAGTGTYSSQKGNYTKFNKLVFFSVLIAWSTHNGTGSLAIEGLPFIPNSNYPVTLSSLSNIIFDANNIVTASTSSGFARVSLQSHPASGGGTTFIQVKSSGRIDASGFYLIN